ncbi:MAG: stage II sporulation protein M [Clostridia bacterium]
MKKYIVKYINENIKSITIFFICLLIGLVVGIVVYQFIDIEIQTQLCSTIKSTLDLTKDAGFDSINVIKNGILANTILVVIIYLASITFIAPGLICIIDIFKGLSIGLYIPTLFQTLGFSNGLLAILLLVIIPNIIYIPTFIYISVNGLNFHYSLMDETIKSKLSVILKEIYLFIVGFSIIFLSVIIEQFTSLAIISIYKGII